MKKKKNKDNLERNITMHKRKSKAAQKEMDKLRDTNKTKEEEINLLRLDLKTKKRSSDVCCKRVAGTEVQKTVDT